MGVCPAWQNIRIIYSRRNCWVTAYREFHPWNAAYGQKPSSCTVSFYYHSYSCPACCHFYYPAYSCCFMMQPTILWAFIASFLTSALLTPLCIPFIKLLGLVDDPKKHV